MKAFKVAALVAAIKDTKKALEMVASLQEFGLNEEEFNAMVDHMAEAAVLDPCTGTNPRETSSEEMKKLYLACYYGEDVNF